MPYKSFLGGNALLIASPDIGISWRGRNYPCYWSICIAHLRRAIRPPHLPTRRAGHSFMDSLQCVWSEQHRVIWIAERRLSVLAVPRTSHSYRRELGGLFQWAVSIRNEVGLWFLSTAVGKINRTTRLAVAGL